ncbi:MAG: hypothetical protein IKI69_01030 [Oscillospiraceae bacterium]|nr:hypothetical protein [Oscillospiraceae bacterium]
MGISLLPYSTELETEAVSLIQAFWLAHNDYVMPCDEAKKDLEAWTTEGHRLYLVRKDESLCFLME